METEYNKEMPIGLCFDLQSGAVDAMMSAIDKGECQSLKERRFDLRFEYSASHCL